jgi:dihydroorotase
MTRRKMLSAVGTSVVMRAVPLVAASAARGSPEVGESKPYDLLIKGGKVIDPSQGLEGEYDVAVRAGKIASVALGIPETQAGQVIQARGKIVTPGLIDLHVHVFPYVGPYGIEPDPYCVRRGVTSVIDAGTSGAFTFPAFRRFIIEHTATRIRALLHVVSIGMVAGSTPDMGELEDLRYCDPKLAAEAASKNRDLIVGFKIRFSKQYTRPNDLEGMRRARAAADEAGLPIMIHIGGSYSPLKELLALLKKGDVVTHSFNSHPNGLLDSGGKIVPEVLAARERGVLFDVGHGAGSFSFEVMEKCLNQGFSPDTISSDLYSANINGPVYDLVTTLSKFLLLGMNLHDVIARATVNSSRVFDFAASIGTLKPGSEADVSVLELKDGEFTFTDSDGKTRMGRQKLEAVTTLKGGKVFEAVA